MRRVDHEHDGGCGDHDNLEGPEADVGQWRELVEAHVWTARLIRIAFEFTLFVRVNAITDARDDDDTKDDEESDPELADQRRVLVDLLQPAFNEMPRHPWLGSRCRKGISGGTTRFAFL